MNEPTFDRERLDVYRLSIDYVAYSYCIAKGLSVSTVTPAINGFALPNQIR